ncbi:MULTISPECIES: dephospho-CoA kinase [unclassified Luteimonas]|uniref:dephospho-CoA kinase n=1 Tax=unclassified Luteimonas TaxID=2629088 RepID=UPI0018F0ADF0|nr:MULTISPECIES: dephospho-CoA kinase [unclassified Luteimonas]MBJ6980229.1 dephospho-CoA kinase [Luteimonas sp. MC1895]MBJ6985293.1 dephospho-CoA kinase [Luteimonas sp. MC1750]QQO05442.1 dephospho-CoA kinase [Luteimonas sp. MC1750]
MADYTVALTGGIASGKSEVERRFRALGVHVADADLAAREVVAPGTPGLAEVVRAFGPEVLGPDGAMDRPAMRRRVFADDVARRRLEAIIHPRVRAALRAACEAAPGPYAIAAIPLYAEAGAEAYAPWVDRVLVVDVPVEVQLERLLRRDGIDEALAWEMIRAQATREQRLAVADDVIANQGPLDELTGTVSRLHARYLRLAEAALGGSVTSR